MSADRELEGFDIDLAKLVAASLGVKLELVQATAANRVRSRSLRPVASTPPMMTFP